MTALALRQPRNAVDITDPALPYAQGAQRKRRVTNPIYRLVAFLLLVMTLFATPMGTIGQQNKAYGWWLADIKLAFAQLGWNVSGGAYGVHTEQFDPKTGALGTVALINKMEKNAGANNPDLMYGNAGFSFSYFKGFWVGDPGCAAATLNEGWSLADWGYCDGPTDELAAGDFKDDLRWNPNNGSYQSSIADDMDGGYSGLAGFWSYVSVVIAPAAILFFFASLIWATTSALFTYAMFSGATSTSAGGGSSGGGWYATLTDLAEKFVKVAFGYDIYTQYLAIFLLFVVLWLVIQSLKGAMMSVTQGIVYVFISIIVSVSLMANPVFLLKVAGDFKDTAMDTIGVVTAKAIPMVSVGSGSNSSMKCNIPAGNGMAGLTVATHCEVWRGMLFEPWVRGQFGYSSQEVDSWGMPKDANKGSVKGGLAEYAFASKLGKTGDSAETALMRIAQHLGGKDSPQKNATHFRNWTRLYANTGEAFSQSIVALVGTIVFAMIFIPLSIKVMGFLLMQIVYLMLLPIFLMFGAHPSFGTRVMFQWANGFFGAVLNIILYSMWALVLILMVIVVLTANVI